MAEAQAARHDKDKAKAAPPKAAVAGMKAENEDESAKKPAAADAGTGATKRAPAVVHPVTMTDGRIVDFPGKRRLQKDTFITPEGKVSVRLDFVNGETRTFVPREDMYPVFVGHGAEQKLGDEMAGIDDIDDAVLAVDELIENLNKGEWSQKREPGTAQGTSVLLRAMVEYTGKPLETVKEFLKDKTPAEKNALKASKIANKAGATIKSIVDRLEEEKAAKGQKVDAKALLEGFAA
jgi:hypothetical protein